MNALATKSYGLAAICAAGVFGCLGSDPLTNSPPAPAPALVDVTVTSSGEVDLSFHAEVEV